MPPRSNFIEPCRPSPADKPPSGANWIHEIKHDGYRLMARRDPVGIRLLTRRGLGEPLPACRGTQRLMRYLVKERSTQSTSRSINTGFMPITRAASWDAKMQAFGLVNDDRQ
jgi:hypothetical protein